VNSSETSCSHLSNSRIQAKNTPAVTINSRLKKRSSHLISSHLISSQVTSFRVNWLRCDWSQPRQTGSRATRLPSAREMRSHEMRSAEMRRDEMKASVVMVQRVEWAWLTKWRCCQQLEAARRRSIATPTECCQQLQARRRSIATPTESRSPSTTTRARTHRYDYTPQHARNQSINQSDNRRTISTARAKKPIHLYCQIWYQVKKRT